ncbi:PD-(D/E)XK nuclease family protein [Romeria aff. gracilis LEGE 07310]|uniref:PD-(D/E)XK nuclease family protein n=1 Tax=Vasconcelosia minhoensis LEGE 07310 TaxID=915328 RepID=A0A8J7A9V8_9CYAN|nr:PD-(D/E)XK nuclease family protein [Romeria gracilis]MBE9076721.1 PD-(D/E)XK nuclease family protein [Romeria aff. gracilis LEGE 07310]
MPPLLPLSQGQLTLFEACARKYQYIYQDGLTVPIGPEQQARTDWGSQFHQLMQQQELGLPVEPLVTADPELRASFSTLQQAAPDLFTPPAEGVFRQSEHRRTLVFKHYLLTAIYDRLILSPERAEIIDWKTHLTPPPRSRLQQDWQLRLYLYVLAETTQLPPEQISMTYWFVRQRDSQTRELSPSSHRFSYDRRRHRQTEQDLTQLTEQLDQLRLQAEPFPKVARSKGLCKTCTFCMRCDRLDQPLDLTFQAACQLTPETVAEIAL